VPCPPGLSAKAGTAIECGGAARLWMLGREGGQLACHPRLLDGSRPLSGREDQRLPFDRFLLSRTRHRSRQQLYRDVTDRLGSCRPTDQGNAISARIWLTAVPSNGSVGSVVRTDGVIAGVARTDSRRQWRTFSCPLASLNIIHSIERGGQGGPWTRTRPRIAVWLGRS
jgi:hypothetical protein